MATCIQCKEPLKADRRFGVCEACEPSPNGASLLAVILGKLAIPVFVFGLVGFMMFEFSSSVTGQARASGDLGAWTFTPASCASGEVLGFHGVEVRSEEGPRLRIIQDELGQKRLAVLGSGSAPRAFTPEECEVFELNVRRTGSIVNEVHQLKGSARFACPGLQGSLEYDRCAL